MLQQQLPGAHHGVVDLAGKIQLQLFEAGPDGVRIAAGLVDGHDATLEIHTRADGAQHLVAGPEHPFEQLELLRQQIVDAAVGLVAAIDEVDHHHVVLLPVAMATADALLDALRIPRQIVVDDQRAELQIDAFGAGLGGDHHRAALAKVLDQRGAGVGGLRAGDAVAAFVALQPVLVDGLGARIAVAAVEQHDALAPARRREQLQEVVLGAPRLGEDDGLPGCAQPFQFGKRLVQRDQQGLALGVLADAAGQCLEAPQLVYLSGDGGTLGFRIVAAVVEVALGRPLVGGFVQGLVVFVQCIGQTGRVG